MIDTFTAFEQALHQLNPEDYDFVLRADELINDLSPGLASTIYPAILAFFEQHPDSDCGGPGTLVHHLEAYYPNYVSALIESAKRKPSCSAALMLNRILNSTISDVQRREISGVLHSISGNINSSNWVREAAKGFIEYQSRRGSVGGANSNKGGASQL